MATGIEAAGLALAIFPILIEGLKFYADEKGAVKDFFRYQELLTRIGRDLSREQIKFHISCKRFMGDVASQCGIEAGEVDVLINDPNHPRWSDGSFEHTPVINQRSFQQFLHATEDMNEELTKIQELIGLQGSTTKDGEDVRPELLDRTTRRRQWKKIVLVLRKDGITRHLEQAGKLNEFLAFLTQQSHYFIPSNHTPRRNTKHYQQIRSHAIDLYDILKANFPQMPNCKCPLRHDVNMKLEFRSGGMVTKRLLFRTIFTSDVPIFSLQNWCEIDIEPLEIQKTTLCRDSQGSVTMRIATGQSSSSDITQFQNSLNLCSSIMKPVLSKQCLGVIGKTPEKQHRIWTTEYQPQQPAFQIIRTVSLAEVLGDKDFQREQRSRLGLKLVSSVMQLHTTQWLMDIWSKTDISFACSTEGTVDFDNPLIRRSFGSGSQNCNASSPSRNLPRPYLVASIPCLFSLGVVLLELWYGKVLESLKNEDERNMPPQFSDPLCARRLTDELVCGPYFKNAVLRCICGLDAIYTSLEEDAFRDEVEEKIVCPLEEDLKFYCGKTSINECI
ncbi:unnamed protein product [Penicillium salamii]|uniref:DUF7580 domain-containing protein n=1 Tax=Penicillium salamii TaxID=1612424 RepID=A0A9W4J4E8_9EURO|nr:unnamed protein product [Penicillium salamii]CAG8011057.1 unnamed protein product [Penicillium salamii]CAG8021127.1 unnamed protein product [Penicillium salamii]CAG8120623.1 unnamed protein product [Penicillium salamii]CAG8146352.1 unnamed protein product [Penicillium salamii]